MNKLLLSLLLCGCVGITPDLSPEKIYRKDMALSINGQNVDGGVYVLDKKKSYILKAYLYKKSELLKVTSCHREWVFEEPENEVRFTYNPLDGLEDEGYCPLEVGGFDLKGQHSWAFIDFVDDESLFARLGCNGKVAVKRGVSICQSRAGLVQRITFNKPVTHYSPERCSSAVTQDNINFDITLEAGKCIYVFADDEDKIHRLTTIGYQDVMLRE